MRTSRVVLATCSTLALAFAAASPAGAATACNGSAKLCSRTLDKVVLPGTHNAMSNKQDGWGIPNQGVRIASQLTRGIRGMLIDTHYGKADTIDFLGKPRTIIRTATESTPGRQPYLCHLNCESGATPLATGLKVIADFLKANPREVMVFVNESYVTPADFMAAVTSSGLSKYIYKGSTSTWPTLSKMISTGQRVVLTSEGSTNNTVGYFPAYSGIVQETPYSFLTSNLLTDSTKLAASCATNRGGSTGSLFLMNHFITPTVTANYANDLVTTAGQVNGKATIVARAKKCQAVRGKLPSLIAVDQVQLGDVVGAAKSLNGV